MTKLEKIVKEAKAMRKAYPKKYAKWTDYIKAASKKISGLDSVERSGAKTTVNYSRKIATKKVAPKTTQAKLFGTKTHKDTRSHNVNVKVVSGVEPHKGKYFINYTHEGKRVTKYYALLPKNAYKGMDKVYYVMVLSDKGTTLAPLHSVKSGKVVKK